MFENLVSLFGLLMATFRVLKSLSRESIVLFSTFGFFLAQQMSARKTFRIAFKIILRESTETGATPRYPVFYSTPSELGAMLTGTQLRHCVIFFHTPRLPQAREGWGKGAKFIENI